MNLALVLPLEHLRKKNKHHNRQRLVLGPNTLLNVYINNTLDYYITKILEEYTKPTVQQSRINYKHE